MAAAVLRNVEPRFDRCNCTPGLASDKHTLSEPCRDETPDFRSGILLDEMPALHRRLGLILPPTANLPNATRQELTGFGIDE